MRPLIRRGRAGGRPVVEDVPGEGPLGGLATALRSTRADHVLLLAVDSMREFADASRAAGRVLALEIDPRHEALLVNWNAPSDLGFPLPPPFTAGT